MMQQCASSILLLRKEASCTKIETEWRKIPSAVKKRHSVATPHQ